MIFRAISTLASVVVSGGIVKFVGKPLNEGQNRYWIATIVVGALYHLIWPHHSIGELLFADSISGLLGAWVVRRFF